MIQPFGMPAIVYSLLYSMNAYTIDIDECDRGYGVLKKWKAQASFTGADLLIE